MRIRTLEGITFDAQVDASILESALATGHTYEYSCKNGQCGVCKATLIEGEVGELQAQYALTEEDKAENKILTCCTVPKMDVLLDIKELSALKDIVVKTLPARINQITKHSEHIIEIDMRLPPTANFKFLEGQFIDVLGPTGVRRSYSIASCADEKVMKLMIKKVKQGVLSQYWFEQAKVNDLLRFEGPKGTFFFRGKCKKIVCLATGTGIAPIKAILDRLDKQQGCGNKLQVALYWGNRSKADFFWQPSWENLNVDYHPVLSRGDDNWQGRVGYVQDVAEADIQDYNDMEVYACGSLQMIESAKEVLMARGLPDTHFYADAFVSS